MRAMKENTGLHENLKTGIWPQCAKNKTKLENIMIKPAQRKCAFGNFYNKMPDYAK